jgi:hypothetical protein
MIAEKEALPSPAKDRSEAYVPLVAETSSVQGVVFRRVFPQTQMRISADLPVFFILATWIAPTSAQAQKQLAQSPRILLATGVYQRRPDRRRRCSEQGIGSTEEVGTISNCSKPQAGRPKILV